MRQWTSTRSSSTISKPATSITQRGTANAQTQKTNQHARPTCKPTDQSFGDPHAHRRLQIRARRPTSSRASRSEAPETATATATATAGNSEIRSAQERKAACLRDLLHSQDPAKFPNGCQVPSPCMRNHNLQLHNGRLAPQEKADVLASLAVMKDGIFPAPATKYVIAHM